MRDPIALQAFLDSDTVDPAVFSLRPEYRAALIAVDGLELGSSDDTSETSTSLTRH